MFTTTDCRVLTREQISKAELNLARYRATRCRKLLIKAVTIRTYKNDTKKIRKKRSIGKYDARK